MAPVTSTGGPARSALRRHPPGTEPSMPAASGVAGLIVGLQPAPPPPGPPAGTAHRCRAGASRAGSATSPADGALAGAAGAVDGQDRGGVAHRSNSSRGDEPAVPPAGHLTKPGKEVATLAVRPGCGWGPARRLATANDIAMRWSPWLSIWSPPRRAGPGCPQGLRCACRRAGVRCSTPRRASPLAITASRSLSLTRSSSAPVRPSRRGPPRRR
jgi:hypothetical protein